MVWNDPPVDVITYSYVLNNLHLKVKVNDSIIYPNSLSQEDYINNVQVVTIPPCYFGNDTITKISAEIIITADTISTPVQNYSLVITGIFYDNINDPSKEYNILPLPVVSVDPFTGNKIDLFCQNTEYIPHTNEDDSAETIEEPYKMRAIYVVLIIVACVVLLVVIIFCCYYICHGRMKQIRHHRISPSEIVVPTP